MIYQDVQVRGKYNEMDDFKKQEESRQLRISKAQEDLRTAELELANLPPYEPPRDKIVGFLFWCSASSYTILALKQHP